ncbi:fimbrial protein [Pantoea stewartii]|uniref:fimbrial protein n=1 Tax=Pantoea stewartii TaxID=66269 RepID=UPI00092F83D8|nr:fimbrial protein [Pantoea stewartii]
MKSTKKITAVLLLNMSIACAATNVYAASDSANVNVTATVVDNTCTPSWSASGINVPLGRASLRDFTGTGSSGATKFFSLDLTGCGAGAKSVTVTADGTPDGTNQTLFANGSSSGADGVALGLYGGSSQTTQLLPNAGSSVDYPIVDNKVSMGFTAKLIQTKSSAPTSGDFSSVVTLNIAYN